ncbi:hypothetical protein [Citrobacter pasteurii]|nr:hypothetical protein SF123566_3049 [Shigella flexneri 1235-66]CEJ65819.1 hypothetical protein [Citrobacter pasteurii]
MTIPIKKKRRFIKLVTCVIGLFVLLPFRKNPWQKQKGFPCD